jgi:hypothetical protein
VEVAEAVDRPGCRPHPASASAMAKKHIDLVFI